MSHFTINCTVKTIPEKNSVISVILPAKDYLQLEIYQDTLVKLDIQPFLKFDTMILKCSQELKNELQIGSVIRATVTIDSISRRNHKNYCSWKIVSLDS